MKFLGKLGEILDKKTIVIICITVCIGIFLWITFSPGSTDNTRRTEQIGSDIRSASEQQQSAIDRLGVIENGLNDSAEQAGEISTGLGETSSTINSAKERIESSQGIASDSASLIAEGKRIVATVRARE